MPCSFNELITSLKARQAEFSLQKRESTDILTCSLKRNDLKMATVFSASLLSPDSHESRRLEMTSLVLLTKSSGEDRGGLFKFGYCQHTKLSAKGKGEQTSSLALTAKE